MSSSGLIYAFIVGAWAVYLVPMWLRREDELNKARQTQRYTTAIKVLSNKESFERKHGASAEQEDAAELPVAVGSGAAAPAAGRRTLEKVREKERERQGRESRESRESVPGRGSAPGREHGRAAGAATAAANGRGREAVPARGPRAAGKPAATARLPRESASAAQGAQSRSGSDPAQRSAAAAAAAAAAGRGAVPNPAAQALLRLRRRRVVSVLFALTSLGAIVSADLGLAYVWAMLIPAAVLSGYIVWVRKDERARAAERARRHAAVGRAAREAERRRMEDAERAEHARYEVELTEQAEREDLARRSALARRRVAAARARADRRPSPDQGDLPRAANG